MGLFGAAHGWGEGEGGWQKNSSFPKICHTYSTVVKLDTVMPSKIQKKYESHDTPLEFCYYQYFFTRNQHILPYKEIQI